MDIRSYPLKCFTVVTALFDEALVAVRTMQAYLATWKNHETDETVGVVVNALFLFRL